MRWQGSATELDGDGGGKKAGLPQAAAVKMDATRRSDELRDTKSLRIPMFQEDGGQGKKAAFARPWQLVRPADPHSPAAPGPEELALMRRNDELHLAHPFFGSR